MPLAVIFDVLKREQNFVGRAEYPKRLQQKSVQI